MRSGAWLETEQPGDLRAHTCLQDTRNSVMLISGGRTFCSALDSAAPSPPSPPSPWTHSQCCSADRIHARPPMSSAPTSCLSALLPLATGSPYRRRFCGHCGRQAGSPRRDETPRLFLPAAKTRREASSHAARRASRVQGTHTFSLWNLRPSLSYTPRLVHMWLTRYPSRLIVDCVRFRNRIICSIMSPETDTSHTCSSVAVLVIDG